MQRPIRILTAVPICDGHDSAILTINAELARRGIEIVYLGYHREASAIVRAAIQEDVAAIGLSSYNGGHVVFFSEIVRLLRRAGASHIGVFGGGGATITAEDARVLMRRGVDRVFFAGAALQDIGDYVLRRYTRPAIVPRTRNADAVLARAISRAESGRARSSLPKTAPGTRVVGIAGAGGVGKSTLIDECVCRFLKAGRRSRLAILANDPSRADSGGALLGDRASMVYSQHDRVYMRSLATRGSVRGISRAAPAAIALLRHCGLFDLVLVESTGLGQDGDPFGDLRGKRLVDRTVLVMAPQYGGRLQLQKIALLNRAELVVVNKSELPGGRTARSEISARLRANGRNQQLVTTIAARHADAGVDALWNLVMGIGRE